jgi:plasmid replication initiation protein
MPKKSDVVVKESNIIAKAKLYPTPTSVWDERIIALIVAKNRFDDTVFKTHVISIKELADKTKLSTLQHREIKKTVKRLAQSIFGIPKGTRGEDYYPIFSMIGIDDDGNIAAQINVVLRPHYLELEREFALRSLPEFRALASTYSQQLFRFLNSWKKLGEKTVPIEELHNFLDTPPSFRKNFNAFKQYVLEVAHREITEENKTSLKYEWEPIKAGLRKVTAIRFIFRRVKALGNGKREMTEDEVIIELQSKSNQCFEKLQRTNKDCAPRPRSKTCRYCLERGRMYAKGLVEMLNKTSKNQ